MGEGAENGVTSCKDNQTSSMANVGGCKKRKVRKGGVPKSDGEYYDPADSLPYGKREIDLRKGIRVAVSPIWSRGYLETVEHYSAGNFMLFGEGSNCSFRKMKAYTATRQD